MSLQLDLPRAPTLDRLIVPAQRVLTVAGITVSFTFLVCGVLEYANVLHTDVGWFLADQYQYGEARFNANADIHGDWGNMIYTVLALPMFCGTYAAALLSTLRST
jgi:hypothetical protein